MTVSIPVQLLELPALEQAAAVQIMAAENSGTPLHNIHDLAAALKRGLFTARKISKSLERIGFLKRQMQHDSCGRYAQSVWSINLDYIYPHAVEQCADNRHTVDNAYYSGFSDFQQADSDADILDIPLYIDSDTADKLKVSETLTKCKVEKVKKVLEVIKSLSDQREELHIMPKGKPMQTFSADDIKLMLDTLDAATFRKLCNKVNHKANALNYVVQTLNNKVKADKTSYDSRYDTALSGHSFTKAQMHSIIQTAAKSCKTDDIAVISRFLSIVWKKMQHYTYSNAYTYILSMICSSEVAPQHSPAPVPKHRKAQTMTSSAPSYDLDEIINHALNSIPQVRKR